jgi:hypothetical protein
MLQTALSFVWLVVGLVVFIVNVLSLTKAIGATMAAITVIAIATKMIMIVDVFVNFHRMI